MKEKFPQPRTLEPLLVYLQTIRHLFEKKNKHFFFSFLLIFGLILQSYAQTLLVSGTVKDQEGKNISGASVSLKNTQIGTTTNAEGKFSINVSDPNGTLIVSSIGYTTFEVPISNKSSLNISLTSSATSLNNVVVVGYGVQKKGSLTGAVATVREEQLQAMPVGDPASRLQGRVSGVTITNNSAPGASATVRIRGYGSLGNNNPLYVVDGIPRTSMDNINPNDIESMTVLKDASSSAIYGSRAANGVIVVTTKRGKAGESVLTFSARYGIQEKTNSPDLMNSYEIGENLWQKFKNMGLQPGDPGWGHIQYGFGSTPVVPDYILPAGKMEGQVDLNTYNYPSPYNAITRANKGEVDWYDKIFVKAPIQEYNVSVSGGQVGKSNYALSAGYMNQKGILNYGGDDIHGPTDGGFTRYSLRSNADVTLKKWLKVGVSLSGTYQNLKGTNGQDPNNSPVLRVLTLHPILPIYDIRGNFAGTKTSSTGNGHNVVADLIRNNDDYTRGLLLQASTYGQISFLKNLIFKSMIGVNFDKSDVLDRTLVNPEWNQTALVSNLSTTANTAVQYNWINTLNFMKTVKEDHNFNLLLGTEAIDNSSQFVTGGRSTFAFTNLDYMVLSAGEKDVTNSGTYNQSRLFSYFARLNYDFNGKYLLEGVLRRDASSRFVGKYRWGTFPAFSAGWRISQEPFMENLSWLNDLKLRVGWGKNGNDNVGNYNAYTTYIANGNESYYNISGSSRTTSQAGFHLSTLGNPNGRWETNVARNLGLDISVFKSKFEANIDLYSRSTIDMLYTDSRPATWGELNLPNINIGEMKNTGFDLSLTYRGKIGGDLSIVVNGNLSHNENKVVKLNGNPNEIRFGNPTEASFNTATVTGKPLESFYGYIVEGIFNTAEEVAKWPKFNPNAAGVDVYSMPGVFKFKDVNGDGKITPLDRTFLGDGYANLNYGLTVDLKYKKLDLTMFLQGVQGRQLINSISRTMLFIRNDGNYLKKRLYESWTPERYASGAKITVPITINNDANMQLPSTYFIEKGDYLRMKDIQLGYTLNANLFDKVKINNLRVYLQASNLFTLTKYSGLDPEVSEQGIDNSVYPTSRIFVFGFNMKL